MIPINLANVYTFRGILVRNVRKIANIGYSLRQACPTVRLSARRNNSAPTGRLFLNLIFEYFSKLGKES